MPANKKQSIKKSRMHLLLVDLFQEGETVPGAYHSGSAYQEPRRIGHVQVHTRDMKDLAREYMKSLETLNMRIAELNTELKKLTAASRYPERDPGVLDLKERLKPLMSIQKELKEVQKEIENYYMPGWWRSSQYTCNVERWVKIRFAPIQSSD